MDNIIEVEKKTSYGSPYIYPANDQAVKACALWNQKTMTPQNIERLKDMGFIVKQVVVAAGKNIEVAVL